MNEHKREEISVVSAVDTPIALADARPQCIVGNEPVSKAHGHEPCASLATWSMKTHDGMGDAPSGMCPAVVLVCDLHMTGLWSATKRNLARAAQAGARIQCQTCKTWTKNIGDVIWGVERIAP